MLGKQTFKIHGETTMFLMEQLCLKLCVIITFAYGFNWSAFNYKVVSLLETFQMIGHKPV
jgi:hypothetical protein